MNRELITYYENTKLPWGILFYRMVWDQLSEIVNNKVLDFGSGFGITANHLAENNDVTAIEPNAEMVEMRICDSNYMQLTGGLEQLKLQEDNSFDAIICHNVLEYASERADILKEFDRVLKPGGMISIVKHNHAGRIMQKIVFENNVEEALSLLDGGAMNVPNFGQVNYYHMNNIVDWIENETVSIDKVLGVRNFWGLQQNNELKQEHDWQDKMFEVEKKVSDIDEYKKIAFFNHVILRKHR